MRYDVTTSLYDGPLELLVALAKHDLLDVFLIQVKELTAQFRAWAKTDGVSLNDLAEPLPLLGQLLSIKAKRLLPAPQLEIEDEGEQVVSLEELERRLKEYEQFKTVAQVLAELHSLQHEHLTRLNPRVPDAEGAPADEPQNLLQVGLIDLMDAFGKVLERSKTQIYEVEQEAWTVEMKVADLRTQLSVRRQVAFLELFAPGKSTLELVVTFLALLELARLRFCEAVQERPFGEILIVRREGA